MRMAAIKIHANSCLPELVYGVPVQCRTHTHVYVNAALQTKQAYSQTYPKRGVNRLKWHSGTWGGVASSASGHQDKAQVSEFLCISRFKKHPVAMFLVIFMQCYRVLTDGGHKGSNKHIELSRL